MHCTNRHCRQQVQKHMAERRTARQWSAQSRTTSRPPTAAAAPSLRRWTRAGRPPSCRGRRCWRARRWPARIRAHRVCGDRRCAPGRRCAGRPRARWTRPLSSWSGAPSAQKYALSRQVTTSLAGRALQAHGALRHLHRTFSMASEKQQLSVSCANFGQRRAGRASLQRHVYASRARALSTPSRTGGAPPVA